MMDLSQSFSETSEPGQELITLNQECSASIEFDLIEKVQNRRFLYNTEDVKHKDKHIVRAAWREIACELGRGTDDAWCKKKWKSLRDYYRKRRSLYKGKSGQKRSSSKPWPFYQAMMFLDDCAIENTETISNLKNFNDGTISPPYITEDSPGTSVTPTGATYRDDTNSKKPLNKRRLENSMDEVNKKIMQFLDTPEPTKTTNDKYVDRLADRLNKLPEATAAYVCMKIETLMFEVEFRQVGSTDIYNCNDSQTYE